MCVWLFLMLKLAREVVIPVQTQDFSVVQACDFYVYLILCVCDVDPDIHKGQNNVLF